MARTNATKTIEDVPEGWRRNVAGRLVASEIPILVIIGHSGFNYAGQWDDSQPMHVRVRDTDSSTREFVDRTLTGMGFARPEAPTEDESVKADEIALDYASPDGGVRIFLDEPAFFDWTANRYLRVSQQPPFISAPLFNIAGILARRDLAREAARNEFGSSASSADTDNALEDGGLIGGSPRQARRVLGRDADGPEPWSGGDSGPAPQSPRDILERAAADDVPARPVPDPLGDANSGPDALDFM